MRKGPFTMWESDEDNYSEENDGVESGDDEISVVDL